jgi:hypothetical protein
MKFHKILAATLLGALFLMGHGVVAQSISSAVNGAATDETGAAIPGAAVTLTNVNTGVSLTGTTDASGNYSFPLVPLGYYNLVVAKPGFATYKLNNFNVVVGQRATEDVKMSVASAKQEVTVNAGALADLLQPESNDLGTVIGTQTVAQIPLNGRNFLQLGFLAGGVTFPSGEAASSINQTGNDTQKGNRITAINVVGNEPDFTMYLVNGIQTVGTRAGNSSLNLSVSAIDQFEVHYGFFMPDLGPNPGIVDVVTKAGTNKFHGEAFEYFRNTNLIAKDYFSGAPAPYHQNQFGGAIGGPIVKDKLFFFFNYEGYRETLALTSNLLVPTPAEAAGDFSAAGFNIYNPYNVVGGQRQQFSYMGRLNVIDPALINKSSAAALAYYGTSSLPVVNGTNYHVNPKFSQTTDQYTGRFDYNLNSKNNFFFQGTYLNSPETSPGAFRDQGTQFPLDTEYGAIGWNATYGANKVNEARIGWTRNSVFSVGYVDPGVQSALGITGTADTSGLSNINITGLAGFGAGSGTLGDVDNSYQVHDAFNWLIGKHQIKFGADIAYVRTVDSSANISARGGINFQNQFTTMLNCTNPPNNPNFCGGNAFADFLLGTPAGGEAKGMPPTHYRWTTAQPYIQDTWKVTPKFTANLALAWYGTTSPNPVGNNKNFIHGFNFNTGILTFAALGQMNPEVYPMTMTNWAPRIGFSYQIDPKTVVRGGWGLYYTTQEMVNVQYSVVSQFITVDNTFSNTGLATPTYVFGQNLFPPQGATVGVITQAQANSITAPLQYLSETQRSPYVYQYNLDVERTFGPYLVDIAYIGNAAHRLPVNYNPFDCSAPDFTCVNTRIPYNQKYPYAQEVDSIGYSNYNGLIAKFQRQFTNGLSFIASYTYSKSLADAQQGGNTNNNQMKSCFQCDYGMATYNVPQAVNIGAVWDIPYGRGRRFGSSVNKTIDLVAGGWNLDVITNFQKGTPFNFTEPNHTLWTPGNTRPNRFCNGRNELANKDVRNNGHVWFQTSCFAASYTSTTDVLHAFGNTYFDPLTGPGIDNWDLAVHKDFAIYRDVKFGLRGEFFNALNHADFSNPDSGVADANFGKITTTQHLPRVIQVAGKITF